MRLVTRRRRHRRKCKTAGPEKTEAYSQEYVGIFRGRERSSCQRLIRYNTNVNVGQAPGNPYISRLDWLFEVEIRAT